MKLAISIIAGLAALQCVDAFDVVKMLCLVNKQRQQNNRLPLGLNQLLVNAANQHSNAQAQANSMSHQLSGEGTPGDRVTQAGYQWTSVAENVAYGWPDEETCVQQWMNSPGHRANILGDYTQFGAGVAYSSSNVPYYTQDFGANGEGNNYPECPSDVYGGNSSYTPAPATTTAYEPAPAPAPTATDTYEPAPAPAPTATDTYEPAPAPAPVTTVNGDANVSVQTGSNNAKYHTRHRNNKNNKNNSNTNSYNNNNADANTGANTNSNTDSNTTGTSNGNSYGSGNNDSNSGTTTTTTKYFSSGDGNNGSTVTYHVSTHY